MLNIAQIASGSQFCPIYFGEDCLKPVQWYRSSGIPTCLYAKIGTFREHVVITPLRHQNTWRRGSQQLSPSIVPGTPPM